MVVTATGFGTNTISSNSTELTRHERHLSAPYILLLFIYGIMTEGKIMLHYLLRSSQCIGSSQDLRFTRTYS